MPGFFDIIFRASKPEPKAPQPKKAKKAKKTNNPKRDSEKALKAENKRLRKERDSLLTSVPEPEIVTEEPEDDESS